MSVRLFVWALVLCVVPAYVLAQCPTPFYTTFSIPTVKTVQHVNHGHHFQHGSYITPTYASNAAAKVVVDPYQHAAHANHAKEVILVPFAQKVVVTPEFFFSVRDYHRDAVILELLAERRAALSQPNALPAPSSGYTPSSQTGQVVAGATAINPKLQALVNASCVRCHGGEQGVRGSVNLTRLADVDFNTRMASYRAVLKGDMPKGGIPLSDADTGLFFEWAKQAK